MSRNPHLSRLPYAPEVLGHARLDGPARVVAGSTASMRITYVAGRFGIDDQGSVRFLLRFASDAGRPQFDRPNAPNYCSVTASNGATLTAEYHPRGAFRPWFKAIRVNVMRGALREGDAITLVLGDRAQGSAGWRVSSMQEPQFEVRVQVDPWGTVVYGDVDGRVAIDVVPGAAHRWRLVLPTLRSVGDTVSLCVRADDLCGNPVARLQGPLHFDVEGPLEGLPSPLDPGGQRAVRIESLRLTHEGTVRVSLRDAAGRLLARSNPLCVVRSGATRTWWGDFHAQSEETIGTNPALEYFTFARDLAFCDFVGHQGNDFQISNEFWRSLNGLYREFNAPGRFVTIPGYEYSPVTHLGGDRNIFFFDEGRPIRRSSHALVEDVSDIATDCNHVRDLFAALRRDGENALAFAHVGGRYADLSQGHDGEIERSVEVHSCWGTFEWLLFDAFRLGHRVGVVCNSDDHKGRPGASHPGASIFGAYGGLTCLVMPELSRAAIWDCLKRRHHYGTTGDRLHLAVEVLLPDGSLRYDDDPRIRPEARAQPVRTAVMGDIVRVAGDTVALQVSVEAACGIERIDVRCAERTLETRRPYDMESGSRRLRLVWEGAEHRGRSRMTTWDGTLKMRGNAIRTFAPINFLHLEKALERDADGGLRWESVTTGNFSGAEFTLDDARTGELEIQSTHVKASVAVTEVQGDDLVLDAGGLERRMRLYRLPEAPIPESFRFESRIPVAAVGDTPVYVRVTLLNGHQAWSSPIYLFRSD